MRVKPPAAVLLVPVLRLPSLSSLLLLPFVIELLFFEWYTTPVVWNVRTPMELLCGYSVCVRERRWVFDVLREETAFLLQVFDVVAGVALGRESATNTEATSAHPRSAPTSLQEQVEGVEQRHAQIVSQLHHDVAQSKLTMDRTKKELENEKREHLRNVIKLQQEISKFKNTSEAHAASAKQLTQAVVAAGD
jgi:hypothetical protein